MKSLLKIILPIALLLILAVWRKQFLKEKNNLKKVAVKAPVVAIASQEEFFLVDEDGAILGRTAKTDLPVITGSQPEDETIKKAISVLLALQLSLWEPREIRLASGRYLEIWFKDNLEVLFSLLKETQIQLDSLQLIFSRAKIEGRKIKKVDLRFDKPVVTYE